MLKVQSVSQKGSVNIIYGSIALMTAAFIMAGTTVSGVASPFNAVVAGAAPPVYSTAVLTGSLIFYFFTGNIIDSLAMIGTLTLTVISRWIFDSKSSVFKAVSAFICMLASSVTVIISAESGQPYALAMNICMSVLTGIAVYFLSDVIASGISTIQISGSKGCSYAVVCILLITALTSLDIWKFNAGRITGVFFILTAAAKYRYSGGAVCGIFTTCGTMLCSAKMGMATVFFSAAGMITGFFNEFNRIIFGLFFVSVNILGLMLIGVTESSLGMLCDVALGTMLFWIIPDSLIRGYFPEDRSNEINPVKLTSSRVDMTVRSLAEIRTDAQNIVKILDKNGEKRCGDIKAAVLKEKQNMLFSQMQLAENMISAVCRGMSENICYDRRMTEAARNCMLEIKSDYKDVTVYKNSAGRIFIELYFDNITGVNCEKLGDEFSSLFLKKFEYTEKMSASDEYMVTFSEKTSYIISCFAAQCGASENELSGDSTICFDDTFGNTYLVISDGMGSGADAAIDSKITVNLFKRLITSGIDSVTAISMINSIMLSKSSDESFATLDIAKINLDTGELTLIKSGASATLIKHDENVMMVNAATFPIGIMNDTKPFVKKFSFSQGDSIVMLSDGVSDKSYQYIKTLMLEKDSELSSVSRRICENAKRLFSGRRDDITVLAARLISQ
ncbi:MAG: SpoIIE family protein phosphatase [Oscillospiraceae bacterium]